MLVTVSIFLFLLVAIFILFRKKTLHVAKRGKDSKGFLRGTLFRPYRTIQVAVDQLPLCICNPYIIKIHQGSYFLPKFDFIFNRKGTLTLQGKHIGNKIATRVYI